MHLYLRNTTIVTIATVVSLLTIGILFNAQKVSAQTCEPQQSISGIPTWYKYLDGKIVQGKCSPVINASKDASPIGLAVFDIALTISGLVAVVMIFIGSFRFILTTGEPEKAASARKTIINALIGMVIVLIAARVVAFIASRIR